MRDYLLGRAPETVDDVVDASSRYATLVQQGKDIRLWETALRQQIYLGDDSFVTRIQSLLNQDQQQEREIPLIQRHKAAMPVGEYLRMYRRNEAIVLAYHEGGHTMSAIAQEVELSVTRVSRIISEKAKGKT